MCCCLSTQQQKLNCRAFGKSHPPQLNVELELLFFISSTTWIRITYHRGIVVSTVSSIERSSMVYYNDALSNKKKKNGGLMPRLMHYLVPQPETRTNRPSARQSINIIINISFRSFPSVLLFLSNRLFASRWCIEQSISQQYIRTDGYYYTDIQYIAFFVTVVF